MNILLTPQIEEIWKEDGSLPLPKVALVRSTQDFNNAVEIWTKAEFASMHFSKPIESMSFEKYSCNLFEKTAS